MCQVGSGWVYGDGPAAPCMGWCMGGGGGDDVVGVGKMPGYTIWIGVVGLGGWERSCW